LLQNLQLDFNPASLIALNVVLALVMYGVALDLEIEDFKRVLLEPKAVIIGLSAQLVVLPALTWGLTMLVDPAPSLALGMILVAACPGGNMSNFFTHYAKGNAELSITMTSIVTVSAVVVTPFNIAFWGSLNPATAEILREVHLDPVRMFTIVGLILLVPIMAGIATRRYKPEWADRLLKPFKLGSLVVFAAFVVIALAKNFEQFVAYIDRVFLLVMLHNGLAFLAGWSIGGLSGMTESDRRALTIEVGIQNSGLGLVLVFNFFGGQGGMALVAAWWGVWHLLAGLTVGTYWTQRQPAA